MWNGGFMKCRTLYIYAIFDVQGDITYEVAQNLERSATETIPEGYTNVVINMEHVPRIDSSSLGVLLRISVKLAQRGIVVFLMGLNEQIKGVMKIAGTNKYFRFIPNEAALVKMQTKKELDAFLGSDVV